MPRRGFTLIELLVVVAIIALMVAIILPSLRAARRRARITVAHCDLRQITTALDAYALNHRDRLPPTYASCMEHDTTYALPAELWRGKYLQRKSGNRDLTFFPDAFDGRRSYKYRAPEQTIMNGSLTRLYSRMWVPDDVPDCDSEDGDLFPRCGDPSENFGARVDRCSSIDRGPVAYAVWSMGPEPSSPKFPASEDGTILEGDFPLKRAYWLEGDGDTGLITHFATRKGLTFTSP